MKNLISWIVLAVVEAGSYFEEILAGCVGVILALFGLIMSGFSKRLDKCDTCRVETGKALSRIEQKLTDLKETVGKINASERR